MESAKQTYDREYYKRNKAKKKAQMQAWYNRLSDKEIEGRRVTNREWQRANPDKARGSILKSKYGLTLEEYNFILSCQNGVCAICKEPERKIEKRTGKIKSLAVDHCHRTGKIRGLLCDRCNVGLGYFNDSSKLIEDALNYVRSAQ